MDIYGIYMAESPTLSSRNTSYRDYEQFPYGSLEDSQGVSRKDYYSRVQEKCRQANKTKHKSTKDACPFCQEQKKRPLGGYLKKRTFSKETEKICEEEEEHCKEDEEEEEEQEEMHEHCDDRQRVVAPSKNTNINGTDDQKTPNTNSLSCEK